MANLFGTTEIESLTGTSGADLIKLHGGHDYGDGADGNDRVEGGDGDDTLLGADGNDSLIGGRGNDVLYGGNGFDLLSGHFGDDVLDGSAGSDRFGFVVNSASAAGRNFIVDFSPEVDYVWLSQIDNPLDFADFDTNSSRFIDQTDSFPSLQSWTCKGEAKLSLVLDGGAALGFAAGFEILVLFGVELLRPLDVLS